MDESNLWERTAGEELVVPVLDGSRETEIGVVGAGYTGLSAALHLAERGRRVVVLEAGEIGEGASGRNGGQVLPGLKQD
ncbi:MAG TPA: FAD-binding oxidoreductase, partial [Rhodospirillales bacterium]|nr:FAD-binding oxidoreductase [Rhodospirillales bacterium]